MLTYQEKSKILKTALEDIGDFEPEDVRLTFLEKLDSKEEIERWVERMTSLIVMKFDQEEEGLGEFVIWNC